LESIDPATSSAVIRVTLLIASTPTYYTIYLNQPLDIDVDHDGEADIRVTLISLYGSSAAINYINLRAGRLPNHLLALLGVGG